MTQELTGERADCCVFCKTNVNFKRFYVGILIVGVCEPCQHLLIFDELKRRGWLPIVHKGETSDRPDN